MRQKSMKKTRRERVFFCLENSELSVQAKVK